MHATIDRQIIQGDTQISTITLHANGETFTLTDCGPIGFDALRFAEIDLLPEFAADPAAFRASFTDEATPEPTPAKPYRVTRTAPVVIVDETPRPTRDNRRPYTGYCRHGVYTGGCGIDWMCGKCEDGWTRRDDLDEAMRKSPTYRVVIDSADATPRGIYHRAELVHNLARIVATHGTTATIVKRMRDQGRVYEQTYTYTPA